MQNNIQKNKLILKDLYKQINNVIMRLNLSKKVDEKPINLHYMRELNKYNRIIKLVDCTDDESIQNVKNKVDLLLVIKNTEDSTFEKNDVSGSQSDLEDSAASVEEIKNE